MGRRRKRKADRQVKLTTLEKNIAYLHSRKFMDEKHEEARQSLIRQYITKDCLTRKQQYYVGVLVRTMKRAEKLEEAARLNDTKAARELGWL